jgi:hypothetical protein
MLGLPFLAPRALFLVGGAIWPGIVSRAARPALWILAFLLYAGILKAIYLLRSELPSWLQAEWATWEVLTLAVALLALPAVAPFVLAVLMLVEGRLWRACAQGD